jgi:hypothetical protein
MSANPSLSADQVKNILFSTAVDLGTAGRDIYFGYGRVNASAAVAKAAGTTTTADTTAPTAAIAAPLGSSTVSGTVTVNVNAADNVGVARVDLKVNNTVVASDSSSPFSFAWDSKGVANGMATLTAVARDAAGNVTTSAPISVNVSNSTTTVAPTTDTVAPAVAITNPTNGGTVHGNVNVTVNASDNSGAAGISMSLYVDGALVASGSGSSMAYSWKPSNGSHTLKAALAAVFFLIADDQRTRRRRLSAIPNRPAPIMANVAGSGISCPPPPHSSLVSPGGHSGGVQFSSPSTQPPDLAEES